MGECMWVLIDNTRLKIRLGLISAPQESRTKKEELKKLYLQIGEQLTIAAEKQQKILLLGDFNCKIGKEIKGNRLDVTMGGKMLLKLVNTRKLAILNKTDQCRGLWTRTDEKTKSVIDYIIVDEESLPAMEEMVIDEEKEFSPKPNTADAQALRS